MIHLAFLLLFKVIEGAKNGAYYDNNRLERNIYMIWLLLITIAYTISFTNPLWLIPFALIVVWQYFIFEKDWGKQIHLSENVLSSYMRVIMVISNASIPMMVLTTTLQMVCFKFPINAYIGRDLLEKVDGTNDPSGKTYNVWVDEYELHIPRIANGYTQLYLGILGLVAWLVLSYYGVDFNLSTLFR